MKRKYYILNDGRLRRKDNTFIFEKYTEEGELDSKKTIPIETVECFYCFGENDYNSKFFNFLSQHGIVLHQFNYYGYYSGSFYPREKLVAGEVLIKQVGYYLEPEERLKLAQAFVEAAAFHVLLNLKSRITHKPVRNRLHKIEALKEKIEQSGDIQELMSLEAHIRKLYYECWDYFLNWEDPFIRRSKQPPQNSLNALVSFGNSLLYTTVLGEIYHTQLNPTVSYLHEPGFRRYSLSLDIAEIFKPLLVDRLIFKLINKKMLKLEDFDRQLNYCYLDESGRKTFLQEWDRRLRTTVKHRQLNRHVSYQRLIRLELYKLIKHLLNEKTYKPFHIWW